MKNTDYKNKINRRQFLLSSSTIAAATLISNVPVFA